MTLSPESADQALLLALITAAALLYSSVGHGGASGYLAAMALVGLSADTMKPAALSMNIFVAGLVFARLARAGHFNARLFVPFAIGSAPLAFFGGAWKLSPGAFTLVVGIALIVAAIRLFAETKDYPAQATPNTWLSVAIGAALGFLSGLTGVGGGIFLSPVLLLLRWTTMRENAAIAAAFIFVNSVAGLAGYAIADRPWPPGIPAMIIAALAGGAVGSELAVRRLAPVRLKKVLAVVLLIAATKMIYAASS
jgi:uncharacterized membrane protein YfcA